MALMLALALVVAACADDGDASPDTTESPDPTETPDPTEAPDTTAASDTTVGGDDEIRIAFLGQLSQAQYFVDEAEGAVAVGEELGVTVEVADWAEELDDQRLLNLVDSYGTQGFDAVIPVPANTDIGPALIDIANSHDMYVVASDSPLADANGDPVPFVGLDQAGSGEQVGEIMARIFAEEGWPVEEVFYANVEAPFQVCLERTDAALRVFSESHPDWPIENAITVPYEGLIDQADDAMRSTLTAHPEANYWLIASCNDAGVVGALQALESRGFPVENVIGVGLGGDQSCLAWSTEYLRDGFRAGTYNDPRNIGGGAVRVAVDLINGQDVPDVTHVETPEMNIDNYQSIMHPDMLGC